MLETEPTEKPDLSVRIVNPRNPDNPFQRKVKLGKDLKTKLEQNFDKLYKEWESGTVILKSRLQRNLNLSEGIYQQPKDPALDFPWPNSSKICKPITETRINIIHSFFMSVIRPRVGRLFTCVTDKKYDQTKVEKARRIAAYFNTSRKFNLMYVQKISEAFWAVLRDGTIGRIALWKKMIRRKWRAVVYKDLDQFVQAYPQPLQQFSDEQLQRIAQNFNENRPVHIDEDYDDMVQDSVDLDFVTLKDMVWFPVNVPNQDQTIFIGYRGTMRKSEILSRAKKDLVFDDVSWVETVPPDEAVDAVANLERQIEGLTDAETKTQFTYVHGRYYADLDDDGIDEIYLITYFIEPRKFAQFDRYPFYHGNDFIKFAGFKKRPKRLLYRGVPEMVGDLNEEANIAARQRIDSRAIINSPQFKAVETLNTILNPKRPENRFRPGGIWFIPAALYDKIEQVKVEKKDFGDSLNEEATLERAADNVVGASELRSGRETPHDPRAPAAKTAMLLNQSSIRLDDFVYDFVMRENETLDDVLQLYAQFGPERMQVYVEQERQAEGQMPAAPVGGQVVPGLPMQAPTPEPVQLKREDFLDQDIHLQLSFTSLLENPEYLKQVWTEFYVQFGPDPMVGGIPEVRHVILKQVVDNMPEANGLPIILPLEMIKQLMPPPMPPGAAGGGSSSPVNPPVNPTLQAAITSNGGGSTL